MPHSNFDLNVGRRPPHGAEAGLTLLSARYDSVPAGPGATDDGAEVAALLEVARILRAGRLR